MLLILGQIFWTGFANAAYYVLFTVAFAIVLKVVRLWNFAQAGMMGIAFYTMYTVVNFLNWPAWLALPIGMVVTVGAGLGVELYGLRPLRRRHSSSLMFFIFTLIFSELVAYVLELLVGTEPVPLFPTILSPVRIIGGIAVSNWDLIAVSATVASLVALWLFLRFHRDGQFLLAVSDNGALAELYGISAQRAYLVAIAIAGVLSCEGMYLFGTRAGVLPTTANDLMLFAVIGTLLGGMGRLFAAAAAAVVLALVQSYSVLVIASQWQGLVLYAFLFIVIVLFPRGFRLPSMPRRRTVRPAVAEAKG
jgi:branched-subunit amino acid ABC-type transport system permease component